jgi:hypothetical protein
VSISRLYSRGNLAYGAFVGGDPAPCGNVIIASSDFSSNQGVYGLFVDSSGDVAFTNTLINSNTKTGLYILAGGAVRLNGVEARGNGAANGDYDGAYIFNYDGSSGVTVTSTSAVQSNFSGNKRTGLYIKTRGAVSITNASASGNGYSSSNNRHSGIFIEESAGVAIRCTNAGTPGYLGGNMAYGLFVGNALGNITLSGAILLNDNQAGGAYLINTTPSPASNITISGVMASNNQGAGIEAHSRGQVTIRSVLVEDNWQGVISVVGLYINNTYGTGNVTIAGSSHFNRNGGVGLYILTDGAVSVTGVNARDNGSSGINIYAGGADKTVTLRSVRSQGNGYLSGGNGITISAFGNVTFSDVHALMNHDDGIHVNLNGYNALFQNCVMLGNDGDGLDLKLLGGTYNLVNCLYFGNDADNDGHITGDKDLNIH